MDDAFIVLGLPAVRGSGRHGGAPPLRGRARAHIISGMLLRQPDFTPSDHRRKTRNTYVIRPFHPFAASRNPGFRDDCMPYAYGRERRSIRSQDQVRLRVSSAATFAFDELR